MVSKSSNKIHQTWGLPLAKPCRHNLFIPVFHSISIDTTKEEPFYYDPLWEDHAAVVNEMEADGHEEED